VEVGESPPLPLEVGDDHHPPRTPSSWRWPCVGASHRSRSPPPPPRRAMAHHRRGAPCRRWLSAQCRWPARRPVLSRSRSAGTLPRA